MPSLRAHFVLLSLLLPACSSSPAADTGPSADRRPVEATLPRAERAAADRGADRPAPADGPAGLPCASALDLSPLQLEAHYCVAARFDLGSKVAPSAIALASNHLYALFGGGSPFLLEVKEQVIAASGQLGAPAAFFSGTASGAKIFTGDYLALAPDGGTAAVGYTLDTTDGTIFWGERGGTPRSVDKATGNYRALFLDQTTLLVNGAGIGAVQEGQGVYLVREGQTPRRLIKDLGDFSGHLGLTAKALLAGGYFKDGNKVFGFSLAEVNAAVQGASQLSAATDGDLVFTGDLSDATTLEQDLVVARANASFQVVAVSRVPLTVSGKTVTAGAPIDVVTVPAGAVTVEKLASWSGELALLVTGGTAPQVALVRRKP